MLKSFIKNMNNIGNSAFHFAEKNPLTAAGYVVGGGALLGAFDSHGTARGGAIGGPIGMGIGMGIGGAIGLTAYKGTSGFKRFGQIAGKFFSKGSGILGKLHQGALGAWYGLGRYGRFGVVAGAGLGMLVGSARKHTRAVNPIRGLGH